mmetsp:Transcript_196/g.596  ORF Transcript_196/g.596 Transcript_196/m.596 type:complete len:264 (+) Transcript_196:1854-2645(+)
MQQQGATSPPRPGTPPPALTLASWRDRSCRQCSTPPQSIAELLEPPQASSAQLATKRRPRRSATPNATRRLRGRHLLRAHRQSHQTTRHTQALPGPRQHRLATVRLGATRAVTAPAVRALRHRLPCRLTRRAAARQSLGLPTRRELQQLPRQTAACRRRPFCTPRSRRRSRAPGAARRAPSAPQRRRESTHPQESSADSSAGAATRPPRPTAALPPATCAGWRQGQLRRHVHAPCGAGLPRHGQLASRPTADPAAQRRREAAI